MASVFEERNIPRAILKIGIPAMLGQLTTLIYNLADTYFVALTKVPAQIAAVTLCVPALIIIMSIACVFGMGASSVIARQIGEGKKEESARCFNFSTYAMIFSGILVLIAGLLFIRPIASVLGADEENMGYTCDYLRWIFMGAPAVMLANGLVHSFRSVGLIKEATIGLALGKAVNSLVITLLRNVVLFIPGVIVMNTLFKLNGVILTQLVVEIFLTVICIIMYRISSPRKLMDVLPMKQHKK